ncbi:MAG: FAD-dependent oxidoreductase [Dehalococcoidia bacterium]
MQRSVCWNTTVTAIEGADGVAGLQLRDTDGAASRLDAMGVFVYVGLNPNGSLVRGLAEVDAGGHITVDLWMRTRVPGLLAAGDIRAQSARQLITCAGDGATAALAAERYLRSGEW